MPLIIVGAGGTGREFLWLARALPQRWKPVGFLDDNQELIGHQRCDLRVLGPIDDCRKHPDAWFVIALGDPRQRKAIAERMASAGSFRFATLIHPDAKMSEYVEIGDGTVLQTLCRLTTQVRVGKHCFVNGLATVGHDVTLGDYCVLGPHAALSGNVELGAGVGVGTSAVIVPGVHVGEGAMICAGSVVTKPVLANVLVAGSPARVVRSLDPF